MSTFNDITGQRFERLLVIERVPGNIAGHARWLCQCDCGSKCIVLACNLRSGDIRSCGCLKRELFAARTITHGETKERRQSAEYRCWVGLIRRCSDPGRPDWKWYGARGIRVCERWQSFENFLADMGRKPSPKLSIDRINNKGNYEPGNCRWATQSEQVRNQRKRRPRKST
jgi:hypothetical protein